MTWRLRSRRLCEIVLLGRGSRALGASDRNSEAQPLKLLKHRMDARALQRAIGDVAAPASAVGARAEAWLPLRAALSAVGAPTVFVIAHGPSSFFDHGLSYRDTRSRARLATVERQAVWPCVLLTKRNHEADG